eukprot:GHVL01038409.1.p1 GENE.GHVL01038409.1~~GHVL01038409.1.p1  ORF type:complete len:197 (+),score=37.57 GHVL01038409.1:59-649(+)
MEVDDDYFDDYFQNANNETRGGYINMELDDDYFDDYFLNAINDDKRTLDMEDINQGALEILVTTIGSTYINDFSSYFANEAEMNLARSSYREALMCSILAEWFGQSNKLSPIRKCRCEAVKYISFYQLDDKDQCEKIRRSLEDGPIEFLSEFLQKKVKGTIEVVDCMPLFIKMISEQKGNLPGANFPEDDEWEDIE